MRPMVQGEVEKKDQGKHCTYGAVNEAVEKQRQDKREERIGLVIILAFCSMSRSMAMVANVA